MATVLNLFKTFIEFIGRRSVRWLVLCAASGIGLAAIEVLFSIVVVVALQKVGVLATNNGGKAFSVLGSFSVQQVLFGLICLGFLKAVLHIFSGISAVAANEIFNAHLKIISIKNLLNSKTKFVESSLIGTLFAESFPKVSVFFLASAHLVSLSVQALLIGVCLCISSLSYTLVGGVYLCFVGIFVFLLQRSVQKMVVPMPAASEKLMQGVFRVIKNWFLIRVFKMENIEISRNTDLVIWSATKSNYSNLLSLIGANLPNALGVVLVVVFILLHQELHLMPGQVFVSYLYLFMRFVQSLSQITHFGGVATINMPHFVRVYDYYVNLSSKVDAEVEGLCNKIGIFVNSNVPFMENTSGLPTEQQQAEKSPLRNPPGICIQGLSFRYSEDTHFIIDSLDLEVSAGKQLAIVGPSGSGKSTMLALLLGLLDASRGQILIDGERPEDFFRERSKYVGYAGPDPFLINGSIRDNLLYGNFDNVSDLDIFETLESVGLREFVMHLPKRLQFRIDEQGSMMSTGQKQRLAIARSLLRKPKILILDEVSANLDESNERLLAEKIRGLNGNTTVIIVSHRPGMVLYADNVIDFGKIKAGREKN